MTIKVVAVAVLSVLAGALGLYLLDPESSSGAEGATAETTEASLDAYLVGEMRGLIRQEPRTLPAIPVLKPDGEPALLTELDPKIRLVNVWASWCGPCRAEMPQLARLQEALGDEDFEVAALNVDREGPPKAYEALSDWGAEGLPVYADPSLAAAVEIARGALPMSVIVDRDGTVLYEYIGPLEWDAPEALAFFEALKAR